MFSPVRSRSARGVSRGFTLIELMITLAVIGVVMVVLTTVMFTAARSKVATSNRLESSQAGRAALDMIARDVRSAGYGADIDDATPQPAIAYVDSVQLLINANLDPYPDTTLSIAGWPTHKAPLAYDPNGSPRPFPLIGTTYTPTKKYRTGAEVIRWTLDANNDGVVDNSDITSANGTDASHSPNPNDYVLLRQVYGDSTGNVAGANGGNVERIALVRKPGGSVPALFTVYLKGNASPWNWASGPVPANQLANIERVVVQVTAPSGKPDWRGNYQESSFRTEVYSIRNVPNFATTEFVVDGTIFNDGNKNGTQDTGELGLAGVSVGLGPYLTTTTNAAGYYSFSAAAGTYTLKHTPPQGFRVRTYPDSFNVTIGPAISKNFADTAYAGGNITAKVFEDLDNDGVKDSNEPWREDETLTFGPAGDDNYTDDTGSVTYYTQVGAYTVTLAVPDSFMCVSSNPATGTMTNGGTATHYFALKRGKPAHVKGKVWYDKNGNGVINGGENGIGNIWVAVTVNGDNVLVYDYTAGDGTFDIDVPCNDPPHTTPYSIQIVPPSGYYPTTGTEISGVYLIDNQTITNQNFGVNSFQKVVLTANRALSLASGDLIEKDWNGTTTSNARQDPDIILGADAAGTDQLSVWFNQYNNNNLFTNARTFSRTAPNSVLSVQADSISENAAPFSGRVDVVAGTRYAAAGNFFVWFTQGTSGNEGYLPASYSSAYKTSDNGDVTSLLVADIGGTAALDLIVGTKSPTANQGTIELWRSNGAATPTFSRYETYPSAGSIPGGSLGEISSMQLALVNKNDLPALVVGMKTGAGKGEVHIFRRNCTTGDTYIDDWNKKFNDEVTAVALGDYDTDTDLDLIIGTKHNSTLGTLELYKNTTSSGNCHAYSFAKDTSLSLTGIPMAVAMGDLGGATNSDIVVGYRDDDTNYTGGIQIFYMDNGTPSTPVDPSGGSVTGMVTAVEINNFNYGVKPSLPSGLLLLDIAAAVETSATTGNLVLFMR